MTTMKPKVYGKSAIFLNFLKRELEYTGDEWLAIDNSPFMYYDMRGNEHLLRYDTIRPLITKGLVECEGKWSRDRDSRTLKVRPTGE